MSVSYQQALRISAGRSQNPDAHRWLRTDDRPAPRPPGRVQHGDNRVQEIRSGTGLRAFSPAIRSNYRIELVFYLNEV
jgi:hypothetical protein